MKIDVLIVNYNNADQVIDYTNRIVTFKSIEHILIVDNASTDNSYEKLETLDSDRIIIKSSGKNGGYGYGNNFGVNFLRSEYGSKYILISNSDVYYDELFILKLMSCLEKSNASVAAGVMLSPDGDETYPWRIPTGWQYVFGSCFAINRLVSETKYDERFMHGGKCECAYVDCVPGSLLLIDSDDFESIGGYDEDIFLYCEETVLGIRLRNFGYKTIVVKGASYIHDHPRSNKEFDKQQRLMWRSRLHVLKEYYEFAEYELKLVDIISRFSMVLYRFRNSLHINRRKVSI